jgi:iron complex transport system substrate-binding protein
MKRPEHQWETRRGLAIREAQDEASSAARLITEGPLAGDPRAEMFTVVGENGTALGRCAFGLATQLVDEALAEDEDVRFAVHAWLVARGARSARIETFAGREVAVYAVVSPSTLSADPTSLAARGGPLITLAPSNAELVWALGAFSRVVACESSSDFPPEVESCERLGPDLAPDLDRVAALAPAWALSSLTVPGMERVVTGLRCRGVAQLVTAPRSLADVYDELSRVGTALGLDTRAAEVVADLRAQVSALSEAAAGHRPLRVYLEWWPRPMFTPGADCYSNELIRLAGGINVFGERAGASLRIEPEDVVAADPDVCFVSWCGVPEAKLSPRNLIEREGLASLRAARKGHVFPLDEAFAGRPGPRVLEAARRMAKALDHVRSEGPAAQEETR